MVNGAAAAGFVTLVTLLTQRIAIKQHFGITGIVVCQPTPRSNFQYKCKGASHCTKIIKGSPHVKICFANSKRLPVKCCFMHHCRRLALQRKLVANMLVWIGQEAGYENGTIICVRDLHHLHARQLSILAAPEAGRILAIARKAPAEGHADEQKTRISAGIEVFWLCSRQFRGAPRRCWTRLCVTATSAHGNIVLHAVPQTQDVAWVDGLSPEEQTASCELAMARSTCLSVGVLCGGRWLGLRTWQRKSALNLHSDCISNFFKVSR